jgi:hypothetical protein
MSGEIELSSPDAGRWLAEHFGQADHPLEQLLASAMFVVRSWPMRPRRGVHDDGSLSVSSLTSGNSPPGGIGASSVARAPPR